MSGEHTHPELFDVCASLRADLLAAAARLTALDAAMGRLAAHITTLEAERAAQDIYDYDFLGKPPRPQTIGRDWTRVEQSAHDPAKPGWENTLVYLNIKPTFRPGKYAGALRPRLVRANGDYTMYDDVVLHADALDGDGVSCRNRLYWEAGDGQPTHLELRCIGGLTSASLGTRYRKVATVKDRG